MDIFDLDIEPGCIALSKDAMLELAVDRTLPDEALKVLMFLLGQVEFENRLTINPPEIAQALFMDEADVSRSVNALADRGILLKTDGSTTGYTLSPHYGWKGKAPAPARVLDMQSYRKAMESQKH